VLTAKETSTNDGYHHTNVFRLCLKLYVRTFTDNLSRHIVGKTVGCIKQVYYISAKLEGTEKRRP